MTLSKKPPALLFKPFFSVSFNCSILGYNGLNMEDNSNATINSSTINVDNIGLFMYDYSQSYLLQYTTLDYLNARDDTIIYLDGSSTIIAQDLFGSAQVIFI